MVKAGKKALASASAAEASRRGLEFKLRLPPDVANRIRAKAEREGRPQNRIIINELAEYPTLKEIGTLADRIGHIETLLARYSWRITGIETTENLLGAVDTVLKAKSLDALQAAVERLRIAYAHHGRSALAEALLPPKSGT